MEYEIIYTNRAVKDLARLDSAAKVRAILGEKFTYVHQKKRLGTGDALRQAIPLLRSFKGELVVLPGDAPFITSSVLIELIHRHRKRRPAATVVTALLSDPGSYGRVIRDGYLGIKKIVESKDAKKEYYLTELDRALAMLLPNSSAA